MKTDKKIMAYMPKNLYQLSKKYSQKVEISIAELIRLSLWHYLQTKDK